MKKSYLLQLLNNQLWILEHNEGASSGLQRHRNLYHTVSHEMGQEYFRCQQTHRSGEAALYMGRTSHTVDVKMGLQFELLNKRNKSQYSTSNKWARPSAQAKWHKTVQEQAVVKCLSTQSTKYAHGAHCYVFFFLLFFLSFFFTNRLLLKKTLKWDKRNAPFLKTKGDKNVGPCI